MEGLAAFVQLMAAFAVNLLLPVLMFYAWPLLKCFGAIDGAVTAGVIGGTLYFLRKYIRGRQFNDPVRADGMAILVTGANSGIGFALTKLLNLRGAHVHMLCRNPVNGTEAITKLEQLGCDRVRLTLHIADLCYLQTVKNFCVQFKQGNIKLDAIVCNAGVMGKTIFEKTEDKQEMTYQANFLAHHLLTELLLPILSETGRIVNVSSIMHLCGDSVRIKDINDTTGIKATAAVVAYNRSKLAQVMMTREFSSFLHAEQKIVACHPGNVHSNILENGPLGFLLKTWTRAIIAFVLKTEEDGAQTPLYACLSHEIQSGQYYRECAKDNKVNPLVNDKEERAILLHETREVLRNTVPPVL